MNRRLVLALSIAALHVPCSSFAQDLGLSNPSQPPPTTGGGDKVYIAGGQVLSGTVIEQKEGSHVLLRMPDGTLNRIEWDVVKKVVTAGSADTAPPPLQSGAAAKPAEHSESSTGATSQGVGVGVQGERLKHKKEPGSTAFQMGIDGGFMYGTATNGGDLNIYGGGANLNLMFRAGMKFPGEEGGMWHGGGVDVYTGIFGAGVVAGNTGAGMLMWTFGGALGYQFYSFGSMNEDLSQHGIGIFAGLRTGFAHTTVWGQGNSEGVTSNDAQYGPQLTISFPTYNFGTASRSAFYISGFVLPTGDFLFANIQLGGSFSL